MIACVAVRQEVLHRQFALLRRQDHPEENLGPLERPALRIDHDPLGGGRRLKRNHGRPLRVVFQVGDGAEPALGFEEEDAVGPLRVGPIEPEPALFERAGPPLDAPAHDHVKRGTIRPDDAGLEPDSPAEGNACLGRVLVLLGRYVNPGEPVRTGGQRAAGAVPGRGDDGDEVGRRRLDRQQPRAGEGGERKWPSPSVHMGLGNW